MIPSFEGIFLCNYAPFPFSVNIVVTETLCGKGRYHHGAPNKYTGGARALGRH